MSTTNAPEVTSREERITAGMVGALIAPFMVTWSAFVGTKLWLWFVVPQTGARPMAITTAIGWALLATLWAKRWHHKEDDAPHSFERVTTAAVHSITYPLVFLGIGYLVHLINVAP